MELLDGLLAYLKENRESLTNKDTIKLQGDGKLKVDSLMQVMDVCRKAGFANITFVPSEG